MPAYKPAKPKKPLKQKIEEALSPYKPDIANAKKKVSADTAKVTGVLDKPIQAFNEFVNPELKKARLAQEQITQNRIAAGQNANQTPTADQTQEKPKPIRPLKPEVIRDGDTGEITGVTLPDGRTLLGLKPSEVRDLIEKDRQKRELPAGADEAGTTKKAIEQMQAQQQANAAADLLQSNQQAGVQPTVALGNNAQDLLATAGTSLPSIAAGAASGAGLGAAVGSFVPILGTTIGAVAGGIIGALTAFGAQLAVDRHQTTKEALTVFKKASTTRNTQILNMANSGQFPPAEVVRAYETNLANIREAERELRSQTRGAVGRQLSGAMDELIQVQLYIQNEPYYRAQLMDALRNPQPGRVYPIQEDLNTLEPQ